ncbi:hypothetical protein GQ55_2G468400 [Panicum hallii var. hallii]|uniref:Uncharacterized protein n=1 Tax=Panicum hallii var. hallii TaxID=1504633 RepID=A0A2T7EZX4_9POAL|nr:hypothetical protein GQ55_2G468400 [Panicum hallii var. hallii]
MAAPSSSNAGGFGGDSRIFAADWPHAHPVHGPHPGTVQPSAVAGSSSPPPPLVAHER